MKMRNMIFAAICGFFLFTGLAGCSYETAPVETADNDNHIVLAKRASETAAAEECAVTESMIYENIRVAASDNSTIYKYSDLYYSAEVEKTNPIYVQVSRSGKLTMWLTDEPALTLDDGTALSYSQLLTITLDDIPQYFSTDSKGSSKIAIRCNITTSDDQDGVAGSFSLKIGVNSTFADDDAIASKIEGKISAPIIRYSIKSLSFGEKIINSRIVQWTIPLAIIGIIMLGVMKSAVKIYRLGLESRTDYMTKEDGEKFKAESRQEMKEAKKDLSSDILEICIRDIHKEMKPLKEVQSMAETIKTDRQVMDVKLNAIEEKYEEIRKLSDEVKLLNTRVNNLQYGQSETAEGTRRSGK